MALSSAFHERLEQMERTRNERLYLLEAEKELQATKSEQLGSKLAHIRIMELRCLVLEQRIASLSSKILSLKTQMDCLEARYQVDSQELRSLKCEIEELTDLEKERDGYYEMKGFEMKRFREAVMKFVIDGQRQVECLKNCLNERRSTFMELKGNNGTCSNPEIDVAEMKKSELLDAKANLKRNLATNYQIRAQLQKQLQNILLAQNQERNSIC